MRDRLRAVLQIISDPLLATCRPSTIHRVKDRAAVAGSTDPLARGTRMIRGDEPLVERNFFHICGLDGRVVLQSTPPT